MASKVAEVKAKPLWEIIRKPVVKRDANHKTILSKKESDKEVRIYVIIAVNLE